MKSILRNLPIVLAAVILAAVAAWILPGDRHAGGVVEEVLAASEGRTDSPNLAELPKLPADQTQEMVRKAIARLGQYQAIQGRLRQRVDMFGRELIGSGVYLQGPPESHKFRLELKLQLVTGTTTLQHVSDGKTLWRLRYLNESDVIFQRMDLTRIQAAWNKAPASVRRPQINDALLVGGLPKLFEAMNLSFDFVWAAEGDLEGLPVWIVRAEWKDEQLQRAFTAAKIEMDVKRPRNFGRLDQPAPDYLLVYLGKEDLFPRRIEYRRHSNESHKAWIKHGRAMLTMDLIDVRTDEPIDPTRFQFSPPPGRQAQDRTERMLEHLRVAKFDKP